MHAMTWSAVSAGEVWAARATPTTPPGAEEQRRDEAYKQILGTPKMSHGNPPILSVDSLWTFPLSRLPNSYC
jgi:hypothetical protein